MQMAKVVLLYHRFDNMQTLKVDPYLNGLNFFKCLFKADKFYDCYYSPMDWRAHGRDCRV